MNSEAFENSKKWMLALHRLFVAGTQDDDAPDGSPGRGDQLRDLLFDNEANLTRDELFAIRRYSEDLYVVEHDSKKYTEGWALERLERNLHGIQDD